MAPAATSIEVVTSKNAVPKVVLDGEKDHDLVLRTFRVLIADLVQHFNGGHPGGAMGMAAIGIALWRYTMKYSPNNANWFNRDRFVLSNGHTCLFQYTFLHLAGYKHMTMDQLKTYHSASTESFCPGHPEIEHEGIEVTTGPLGQGVANAVGMAMATKHLAATYNKPGFPVVDNMTWCMIGDACLQEGVGLEAISLAGHWKLNNLVLIMDNNNVTCDGSADIAVSEDINLKMKATGWNVIEIEDGSNDIQAIVDAMEAARVSDKPTFINCHTIIGIGSAVAGDAKAHGAAFGEADVRNIHKVFGFDADNKFSVTPAVYDFFKGGSSRGNMLVKQWEDLLDSYAKEYPQLGAELKQRIAGDLPTDWESVIPTTLPTGPTPSRKSAGLILNPLAEAIPSFMVGTADLSPSVYMTWPGKVDFQSPSIQTKCGAIGDYGGRYIHYGIREHAMASIANGLAAYNRGTIVPVTSSFFMFYLYAAPGVRMGALQELQIIHIATHDSIGTGEDGPTHQPIELAALYRAMPNLLYIRPCDSEETAGAVAVALKSKHNSSIISTSRQNLPQYPQNSKRSEVAKGAYVFRECEGADVTLIGVGPEMCFAMEAADELAKTGVKARVLSFPCQRLFEKQSWEYKRSVLKRSTTPAVVVEAYAANGWERYADASISMKTFGKSLPGKDAYKFFGFDGKVIAEKTKTYLGDLKAERSFVGEFREL